MLVMDGNIKTRRDSIHSRWSIFWISIGKSSVTDVPKCVADMCLHYCEHRINGMLFTSTGGGGGGI